MPRWGVLISKPVAEAIRAGTVTQAFRRWDVPRVKVGGLQLTPAGLVRFDAVSQVRDPAKLTERDARKAGVKSLAALQKALTPTDRKPSARGGRGGDKVYRIRLSWAGEDPRIALREKAPDDQELQEIATGSLGSMRDRVAPGPATSSSGSATTLGWSRRSWLRSVAASSCR